MTEKQNEQIEIATDRTSQTIKIKLIFCLVYIPFLFLLLLLLMEALQAFFVLKLDWTPMLSLGVSRLEEIRLLAFLTQVLF